MAIKFLQDIDVDGEVQGTSLDINGAANIDGLLDVNTGSANTVAIFESTDDKAFIRLKDNDTDTYLISKDNLFSIGESSTDYNNFKVDISSGNTTVAGTFTAGGRIAGFELEGTSLDINGAADIAGNLTMVNHTLTANNVTADSLNLKDGGDFITFYGGDETNHSISSRDSAGSVSDDLRINSYGALYINLDSNNNNSSNANFVIGRHGSATGTIVQDLLTLSGENGKLTVNGEVEATSLDINGDANISGTLSGNFVVRSTNNSNVDGANFAVDTTNKSSAEYAYEVLRSGTTVAGITMVGKVVGTELEGTSLDINGNADISGNLTGVDAFTATPLVPVAMFKVEVASIWLSVPSWYICKSSPTPRLNISLSCKDKLL